VELDQCHNILKQVKPIKWQNLGQVRSQLISLLYKTSNKTQMEVMMTQEIQQEYHKVQVRDKIAMPMDKLTVKHMDKVTDTGMVGECRFHKEKCLTFSHPFHHQEENSLTCIHYYLERIQ
jgi:hypothetical protein